MISILYAIVCMSSLCLGFYFGFKLGKKEEIKTPIQAVKQKMEEKKEKEIYEEQMETFNTILHNINNYDGTSKNQKEIKNNAKFL